MPSALIRIVDPGRYTYRLQTVEVARGEAALMRGLRGRWPITPLLLVLPAPEARSLTTIGVHGPLDVAWVDPYGVVSAVTTLLPGLERVSSPGPWSMALETPLGLARAWGLVPGASLSIVAG